MADKNLLPQVGHYPCEDNSEELGYRFWIREALVLPDPILAFAIFDKHKKTSTDDHSTECKKFMDEFVLENSALIQKMESYLGSLPEIEIIGIGYECRDFLDAGNRTFMIGSAGDRDPFELSPED